jgi:hypothetical protein
MIIRAERANILKHILNLEGLKNSSCFLGKIKYDGDSSKPGSKVSFGVPLLGIEYKFTVNKVDISEKNKRWVYSLKITNEDSEIQSFYIKEISFIVYMIHNKKVLLEVKHKIASSMPNEKAVTLKHQQNEFLKEIFNLESKENVDDGEM